MSISRVIAGVLPRKIVLYIKYIIQRLRRAIKNESLVETSCVYKSISKKDVHVFFGYYDISPFNEHTDEIIYLNLRDGEDRVSIMLSTVTDLTSERKIADSCAWNWQQGSRLRWMPNCKREIIFNDYVNEKYISRIVNVDSGDERIIDYALYDISLDGKWGLSINFERLQEKRPGYGYSCGMSKEEDLLEDGIDLIDLEYNTARRIITYSQISKLPGCESDDLDLNYLNHISFSPSGKKFLFFWLTSQNGPHLSNLVVYDLNSSSFVVLESTERVSHYVWEDDDHIICTAYYGVQDCHYYRYTISSQTKELLCPDTLSEDGHPSVLKKDCIITDTYPDLNGYQRLFYVDLVGNSKQELLSIYSDCRKEGERRTDLHPRISNSKQLVCFDSNERRYRSMYILQLNK